MIMGVRVSVTVVTSRSTTRAGTTTSSSTSPLTFTRHMFYLVGATLFFFINRRFLFQSSFPFPWCWNVFLGRSRVGLSIAASENKVVVSIAFFLPQIQKLTLRDLWPVVR